MGKLVKLSTIYTIAMIVGLGLSTLVVFLPYIPHNISWEVGDKATETIVAQKDFQFESEQDRLKTESLRKRRIELVEKTYSLNPEITKSVISNIEIFFTEVKEGKIRLDIDPKELNLFETLTIQIATDILEKGIKEIDVNAIKSQIQAQSSSQVSPIIEEIILKNIQPNIVYDEAKTAENIRQENDSVKPFITMYHKGAIIIHRGETVTEKHIEAMNELNIYGVKPSIFKFLGLLLLNALLFLLIERFTFLFNKRLYHNVKFFVLMYLIGLSVLGLARLIQMLGPLLNGETFQYLIPIPMAAVLISLLVAPSMALMVGTLIALLVSVMYGGDFTLFMYLFFSVCASTFVTFQMHKRMEFIQAGYWIGGINIVLVIMMGLFREQATIVWYGTHTALGLANGILSAMAAFALMPYLENTFKITTEQTLLELSNLSHPLMKRLMMTAPGTYQHSLMVANLAEAAAESIGANSLLARIGAYYHDIGKTKRPNFFTENQFSGANPHDHLTPRMSKLIISAHPKEGVEIAIKYRIPLIIQDFMMQHHGTSLVSYFYTRAMKTEDITNPDAVKEEFRYPGPKPQFKESGIVMLADALEATLRSLDKPSPAKVESVLEAIIKDKIEDNQLGECPLSLSEIETIRLTFLKYLRSVYHSRIDYNEEVAHKTV